jgi:hypothetical protein
VEDRIDDHRHVHRDVRDAADHDDRASHKHDGTVHHDDPPADLDHRTADDVTDDGDDPAADHAELRRGPGAAAGGDAHRGLARHRRLTRSARVRFRSGVVNRI